MRNDYQAISFHFVRVRRPHRGQPFAEGGKCLDFRGILSHLCVCRRQAGHRLGVAVPGADCRAWDGQRLGRRE